MFYISTVYTKPALIRGLFWHFIWLNIWEGNVPFYHSHLWKSALFTFIFVRGSNCYWCYLFWVRCHLLLHFLTWLLILHDGHELKGKHVCDIKRVRPLRFETEGELRSVTKQKWVTLWARLMDFVGIESLWPWKWSTCLATDLGGRKFSELCNSTKLTDLGGRKFS